MAFFLVHLVVLAFLGSFKEVLFFLLGHRLNIVEQVIFLDDSLIESFFVFLDA
jgi:hypothetical protein